MHGVTTRLPRVSHEVIQYKEWTIPPEVRAYYSETLIIVTYFRANWAVPNSDARQSM